MARPGIRGEIDLMKARIDRTDRAVTGVIADQFSLEQQFAELRNVVQKFVDVVTHRSPRASRPVKRVEFERLRKQVRNLKRLVTDGSKR